MSRTLAIALGYRPDTDFAPRILATGTGVVAEQILNMAAEHGIPCERDSHLADLLAPLQLGEDVPEELYEVVARVFAYLECVRQKMLRDGERGEEDSARAD